MFGAELTGIILIILNIVVSYKGFTDEVFFYKYRFEVNQILAFKRYNRLVTSGFLHVGWLHLIFNMLSLFAFDELLENTLGGIKFLIIYFISLVGGNLLSLFVHRHHSNYSAVGASGAVCGIIFATIALYPGIGIGLFGLNFSIPGWLYGILYVIYSIYGIKSGKDNIGHEAHLGGALTGVITALAIQPSAIFENYSTILIITIPAIVFMCLIIAKPHILLVDNFSFRPQKKSYTIDNQYNIERNNRQKEIDKILDKVRKKGLQSLSTRDKEKLKQYSKRHR